MEAEPDRLDGRRRGDGLSFELIDESREYLEFICFRRSLPGVENLLDPLHCACMVGGGPDRRDSHDTDFALRARTFGHGAVAKGPKYVIDTNCTS